MEQPLTSRLRVPWRLPSWLAALTALFVAGFFVFVVAQRIGYRFELEWMEGAMVDHVSRVLAGQPIYVAPSYDHVAFLYHPGFFYVAGLVSLVTGPGFLGLRLVSLLATFGSCVVIYRLVSRERPRGDAADTVGRSTGRIAGGVAAGIFLAAFSLAGCYYDVGRIDPLFTFLLLLGIDVTRTATTWRGLTVATAVFLLAWLTKQTALVVLPFVVLGCLPSGLFRAVRFGLTIAGTCGLSVWLLDAMHDGWMSYFTLELPRQHGILTEFYLGYWTNDVLPLGIAVGLMIVYLLRAKDSSARWFHGGWILGCVLGSYFSRLHIGGAENVLIPMIAALSVGCGLGWNCLESRWASLILAPLLAVAQLALLFLLPFFGWAVPVVPAAATEARWDLLVEEIRDHEGPVFLPWHGYLATMAGRPSTAHSMAMDDVWRSGNERAIQMLNKSVRTRLQTAPHPWLYVDDVDHPQFRALVGVAGYGIHRLRDGADDALVPPVGARLWPRVVLQR